MFYCVVEAFSKRGGKAVGVLGLDDLAKSEHRGLPRTPSHLNQIALDQKRAERYGTTIERVQMLREATAIYNRFLAPGAPDWVCVDQKIVEEVSEALLEAKEDPKYPLDRTIFEKAKHYVFQNLEQDLLPRFIKASLTRNEPGKDNHTPSLEGRHGAFRPDEVLRHHLLQLQKKPQGVVTSLMSTANAYRSLFPSPRYAIEGREGSGLSPNSLTALEDTNINSDEILAKPPPGASFARKSIVFTGLRPFSSRLFSNSGGESSSGSKSEQRAALKKMSSKKLSQKESKSSLLNRRSSTGTNRAGSSEVIKVRKHSKSEGGALNEDIMASHRHEQINLDSIEFDIPEQSNS